MVPMEASLYIVFSLSEVVGTWCLLPAPHLQPFGLKQNSSTSHLQSIQSCAHGSFQETILLLGCGTAPLSPLPIEWHVPGRPNPQKSNLFGTPKSILQSMQHTC